MVNLCENDFEELGPSWLAVQRPQYSSAGDAVHSLGLSSHRQTEKLRNAAIRSAMRCCWMPQHPNSRMTRVTLSFLLHIPCFGRPSVFGVHIEGLQLETKTGPYIAKGPRSSRYNGFTNGENGQAVVFQHSVSYVFYPANCRDSSPMLPSHYWQFSWTSQTLHGITGYTILDATRAR